MKLWDWSILPNAKVLASMRSCTNPQVTVCKEEVAAGSLHSPVSATNSGPGFGFNCFFGRSSRHVSERYHSTRQGNSVCRSNFPDCGFGPQTSTLKFTEEGFMGFVMDFTNFDYSKDCHKTLLPCHQTCTPKETAIFRLRG